MKQTLTIFHSLKKKKTLNRLTMANLLAQTQDNKPAEAQNVEELLNLLKSEKQRIGTPLYQPQLVTQMKSNIVKLSDTLKYSIDKGAMISHGGIDGINELCPEISKYISILTVSVKIINYGLCDCAANQLIKVNIDLFDSIIKLFIFIKDTFNKNKNDDEKKDNDDTNDNNSNDPNKKTLTTLVGVVWEVK